MFTYSYFKNFSPFIINFYSYNFRKIMNYLYLSKMILKALMATEIYPNSRKMISMC